MLQIVINWTYYKRWKDSIFTDTMWKFKKTSVYFYDYDDYVEYILSQMELWEIEKLKINMYNKYHKQLKFNPFSEYNVDWWLFEWLKVSSPIIDVDISDFAELLPKHDLRKRFFVWDSVREKYFLKSNFINFIKNPCLSM